MAKKHKVPKDEPALRARLGATVRTYRHQLGITQEELAWRADMHRTYLADIERGTRNITLRSVANLAKALQLSVETLLTPARDAGGPARLGTILLVEDNPQDVELTLRAFQHAKLANPITVMCDGAEALHHVLRTEVELPQLVLLDLGLPKVSGLEVLQKMRANRRTLAVPVVVLTNSRQDASILECSRLGAVNYIVKPVEFENFARITSKLDFHWTLLPPEARREPGRNSGGRRPEQSNSIANEQTTEFPL